MEGCGPLTGTVSCICSLLQHDICTFVGYRNGCHGIVYLLVRTGCQRMLLGLDWVWENTVVLIVMKVITMEGIES